MPLIIVNPPPPLWVKRGDPRPPEWMRKWFPKAWEKEFRTYGNPGEIGKYFAEQSMKRMREKFNLK